MKNFQEIQRFNQWWLWIIVLVPVLILGMEAATIFNSAAADKTEGIAAIVTTLLFTATATTWIFLLRLETRLENGILSIHFKGIPFTKKTIDLREVEKLEIVTYNPLFDYGGWGVRYGLRKGWCYNVSGDKGLLITYRNKKTFLLGTQKPDELEQALGLVH
ncbi:MAG: hypothetical protein ACXVPQ_00930 [Bacteroidia bacterium]